MENNKPLVANGSAFINPGKVLWANTEARVSNGEIGVAIQFLGVETITEFIGEAAGAAQAILFAASTEAPNAA